MFLPVELPTGDYYGGHRPGENLFGESLVALDLKTGQRKWHFQLVHHGIWDMDIPCAPILMDLVVDGRPIKAVGQPTKQGWIYTFDRITGKPVWPIEERPVEKGTVPGEWYSPTQPFVTKPPPLTVRASRLTISSTSRRRFEKGGQTGLALQDRSDLTPPVVSKWEGPLATLMLPNATGGANWQGGAFDPETKMFYIFTNTQPTPLGLVKPDPERSDFDWVQGTAEIQTRRRRPRSRQRLVRRQAQGEVAAAAAAARQPSPRPGPRSLRVAEAGAAAVKAAAISRSRDCRSSSRPTDASRRST